MDINNSSEQLPQWCDAAASQLQVEPKTGIMKKLGSITTKIVSPVRNRFEDRIKFNTALPTRTSTPEEVAEFERNHIDSRGMLGEFATKVTVRPQDLSSTSDAA